MAKIIGNCNVELESGHIGQATWLLKDTRLKIRSAEILPGMLVSIRYVIDAGYTSNISGKVKRVIR